MANPNSAAQRSFAAEPYDSVAAVLASKQITAALTGSRVFSKDGSVFDVVASGADYTTPAGGGLKVLPDTYGSITLEQLGAPANGVDSDHEYFKKAEDILSSRGGGWIVLSPGKTYRIGRPKSEPLFPTPNTPKHRVSIWAYGAKVIAPDNSHGICIESMPGEDRFILGGTWDGNWEGLAGAVEWNGNAGQQPAVSLAYGVRPVARDVVILRGVADGFQFHYTVDPIIENVWVLSSGEHAFYGAAITQGIPRLINCGTKNCGLKLSGNGAAMVKFRLVDDFVVDGFVGEAPDAVENVMFTATTVKGGSYSNVRAKDLYDVVVSGVEGAYDNKNVKLRGFNFTGKGLGGSGKLPPQGNVWSDGEITNFAAYTLSGDCDGVTVRDVPNLTFGDSSSPNHKYSLRDIILDNCGANTDTVFTYGKASIEGLTLRGASVPSLFTISGADQRWSNLNLDQAEGGTTVPYLLIRHAGSHTIRGVLHGQGAYLLRTHADGAGAIVDVMDVKTKASAVLYDEHGVTWNASDWFVERSGSGAILNLAHASSLVRYSGIGAVGISTFKTGSGTATNVTQA